jgi:hypothetical protein
VFLARGPLAAGIGRRSCLTHANGQLAIASRYEPAGGDPLEVLQLLTLDGEGHIAAITAFIGVELQPFGVSVPG